ncbi:MAG: VWA domain-containing protein [Thermoanaerobaculia bacterium]
MKRPVVLLLAASLLGPFAVPAQTPEETFGEVIDVRVVNVEAVVTDRKGKRVTGLQAGDFRLLVDGAEVPVDYFTEVAEGVALPAPAPVEDPAGAAPAAPIAPVPAGPVGRSFLVFIDDSLSIAAQRDMVLKTLAGDLGRLGPGDRMAVVAFDGGRLHRLADWTGDRKALAAAFDEARQRPAWGLLTLAERRSSLAERHWLGLEDAARFDVYSNESPFDEFEDESLEPQQFARIARAAEAAAAALRSISLPPGRKAMLLLSGGWPTLRPMRQLIQDANRLGYTLYPVDVPGVDIAMMPGDVTADRPTPGPATMHSPPWELEAQYTLHFLAEATGGKEAINGNRLAALERADEDTRSYYWLGFSPAWKADDRHHKIELQVRRPGLEVRARGGFSDLSPALLAEMETEGLLRFGRGTGSSGRLQVEMGEARPAGWRTVEVPVTLVLPAVLADGEETELVLSVGALDRFGASSELPKIPFRVAPSAGAEARSQVTLRLRNVEQKLVFHVRNPQTGSQMVEELSFQPGK